MKRGNFHRIVWVFVFFLSLVSSLGGCGGRRQTGGFEIKGSDTLVQITTAWAEAYTSQNPMISVNASGGGSGTGFAALINGTAEIASSSREIKPAEKEEIYRVRGKPPQEFIIGYDALALYVHPSNPLGRISIPELQEIWAENGGIVNWDQLTPHASGAIILVGRQNSSGTYDFFRETICRKDHLGQSREFRSGVSELSGSSEVVEQIAKSRFGLGYSGMGYKTDRVKWLAVAPSPEAKAVLPSVGAVKSGEYPLARKLYLYTVGEPVGDTRKFLDWALGRDGQLIVVKEGFVPVR